MVQPFFPFTSGPVAISLIGVVISQSSQPTQYSRLPLHLLLHHQPLSSPSPSPSPPPPSTSSFTHTLSFSYTYLVPTLSPLPSLF
ncbi:hypothetical protein BU24DRAFT_135553 [Aaosphaeria arxii CBS 175.79]|uniref:Uncharacterized protein n=1 Tax=Aaosphaeria arxii CBS 175.79 TaxID=1450172 RepID=A0A6A5Y5A7_9PLEO|nr:uncharacterized protein BU24DRAFT_135553 [Aaosphaeria arxii CBS 175.79]KAF2020227.1 hypothetical protein BU24DRAFT_135553 [Aaosphaeria arxii CBS 175.79]